MGCLTHYASSLHHSLKSLTRENVGKSALLKAIAGRLRLLLKGLLYWERDSERRYGGVVASIYHDDHRRVRVMSGTQFD